MNYTTAIMLTDDNVRAILCTYEVDYNKDHRAPTTMFKTIDSSIKVDDFVVIPTNTRHGMTVVKVVEVDVEPDHDEKNEVRWVVSKVDRVQYEDLLKQEEIKVTEIKKIVAERKREALKQAMFGSEIEKLKLLPTVGG